MAIARGDDILGDRRAQRLRDGPVSPVSTIAGMDGTESIDNRITSMSKRSPQLAKRLKDKRVIVCLGAGGVGKTTTSAALGFGLAKRGQKVAVVTIDPARRLAAALGLDELSGEPRRIDPELLAAQGVEEPGELWAMALDVKRTFDEVIARLAPDEASREEILENPVYGELSSAVSGVQELSAVTKLYELHTEHDFDTIVLDTPPRATRSTSSEPPRTCCASSKVAP